VQPGNSGGPLLGENGSVVGVVVGKLNAMKVAEAIGDIPQNVNFAVSLGTLQSFLNANGVPYILDDSRATKSPADIAAEATHFTVLLECLAPSPGVANPNPPAAATTTTADGGGYVVQISSRKSDAEAQASIRALQAEYPHLLNGQQPTVRRADFGATGVFYRAVIGPFASSSEANSLCNGLKAAGGQCIVQKN
jgi:hypothetical protein